MLSANQMRFSRRFAPTGNQGLADGLTDGLTDWCHARSRPAESHDVIWEAAAADDTSASAEHADASTADASASDITTASASTAADVTASAISADFVERADAAAVAVGATRRRRVVSGVISGDVRSRAVQRAAAAAVVTVVVVHAVIVVAVTAVVDERC